MKIQYLGHACFRIISEMGTSVITDPYDSEHVGFSMPKVSADVVTVSHHHGDHDSVESVCGNPAVLEKDVYVAADDVAVQSMFCHHDDQHGKLRGENYVFCFLVDGLKVVHMGDVGELDETLANRLYGCDVLMLPVGGVYTVDADGAKWYVDKIQPKIVLPMHYQTPDLKFQLGHLEQFTKLFDSQDVRYQRSETLVIDDAPENVHPKVVILDRYQD